MQRVQIGNEDAWVLYDECDIDEFVYVDKKRLGSSRWSEHWILVAKRKSDGRFFGCGYDLGLTECQENYIFKDAVNKDIDPVIFGEMRAITKTVTDYEWVKQ